MSIIPGLTLENLILIALSYFILLLINRVSRSNAALLLIAILSFRHAVAYLYAFHLSLPENEVDPARFMELAGECINFDYCGYLGYHLYINYLAKMLIFGKSLYFVYLLNTLFFVFSIYYFIRITELLGLKGNRKMYLILYGLWPSVIFYTTLHYREPFELYFLIAGIYYGLAGNKNDNTTKLFASMVLLFLMGLIHIKGLLYLSPVIFLILLLYRMPNAAFAIAKRSVFLVIMITGVYFAQDMYQADINKVESRSQEIAITGKAVENANGEVKNKYVRSSAQEVNIIDSLMDKVMDYRTRLLDKNTVRTAFISTIDNKNIAVFIATYFTVYVEYLFSPFMFQVTTINDFIAYAESILRLTLFIAALVMFKRLPQTRVLFLIYLIITAMWAIGVVSYGASIRHHVQTNWILVILGVPIISEYISRKFRLKKYKKEIINHIHDMKATKLQYDH